MHKKLFAFIHKNALRCWTDRSARHLYFVISTILVVILYGYYFGTFDQASHIPFLKKIADATLFPDDHFFDLRNSHYSYFWLFFLPFLRFHILEVTMFAVHLISIYLTFWALWSLSKTIFNDPLTSFLSVLAFVFPHIGFSGFPLFEFSMLNRTVCLPFELFALNLFLKKKVYLSFFILGLLYNLHALSVNFFIAMLGFDLLLRVKKRGIGSLLISMVVFCMGALPVLMWKFTGSGVTFSLEPEWFNILNRAVFFHLFNFISFRNWYILLLTSGGVAGIILFFKIIPRQKNDAHISTLHWMIAGVIICIIQQIVSLCFPVTILVQSQIMRIGIEMMILTYLYIAHFVAKQAPYQDRFGYLLTALLLSFFPFVFLAAMLLCSRRKLSLIRGQIVMIGLFILTIGVAFVLNFWSPGFYIFPRMTPFAQAQIWAKNHTPRNAVFITPPQIWWMYETEWRVLSERSSVSTFSELLEAAFEPTYISYWKPRFEDVAPGALSQFKGNFFDNLIYIEKAYYSNTPHSFIRIAQKYDAHYLVVHNQHPYPFLRIYSNTEYTIYQLE